MYIRHGNIKSGPQDKVCGDIESPVCCGNDEECVDGQCEPKSSSSSSPSSSSESGPCERPNLLKELNVGACCETGPEGSQCLGIVPEWDCPTSDNGTSKVVWKRHGLCGECH
jgi:hypothetical protein